jgi:transposase
MAPDTIHRCYEIVLWTIQTGLTVYQLPAYSPDFNPIEKLWENVKKDGIHLHYFLDFDSLKQKVQVALLHFADKQKDILELFGFYKEINVAWLFKMLLKKLFIWKTIDILFF